MTFLCPAESAWGSSGRLEPVATPGTAGGQSDGAFPGSTTNHHKRTLSTLPHYNIISRTSESPQVSPSTYQLHSSQCAVSIAVSPLLADQTQPLIVFRFQLHSQYLFPVK
ncbi:hypothetical protein ATANTOWER_014907 [Ataeniobius toweri]|uniref:Uncharacterized protein n=1 Tax=Ataeniobius toweri TaxID=208326 RepID=A0ABU7BBV6_9TELE|nr:hypothetical protein [Ataeniobius toweri]